MAGSIGIFFWVGHLAFWVLLVVALARESRIRLAAIFMALWIAGYVATAWAPSGSAWFMSYVAALDIALVLFVFKGDIRLT
jgi:hypothetical protein